MSRLQLLRDTLELLDKVEDNLLEIERGQDYKRMLDYARNIRWYLNRDLGIVEAMRLCRCATPTGEAGIDT